MCGLKKITWRERLIAHMSKRQPDVVIGGAERPYLLRWWLIPRNPVFNIYVHKFLRSDDDRALHDHPWMNCSILLRGFYMEHTPDIAVVRRVGDIVFRRSGRMSHRIELFGEPGNEEPCWTLFITGPRYREWGFHCPAGWVHWQKFTAADDPGAIGKGCDQ